MFIKKWHDSGYQLNYGKDVIIKFVKNQEIHSVLDIGCGTGRDLMIIKNVLSHNAVDLHGICDGHIDGVTTCHIDIECSSIPYGDNRFDLTLSNQVFEHLKNWLWVLHEQVRVTKVGGGVIVGFPNLAALHCRIQLLFGKQPSCIKIDDAHVRGFTTSDFERVIDSIPGLEIRQRAGANIYGLPPSIAKIIGARLPNISVSIFYYLQKTSQKVNVIKKWKEGSLETNFFTGL